MTEQKTYSGRQRQDPDRRQQGPERSRSGGLQDQRQKDFRQDLLIDLMIEQAGAIS